MKQPHNLIGLLHLRTGTEKLYSHLPLSTSQATTSLLVSYLLFRIHSWFYGFFLSIHDSMVFPVDFMILWFFQLTLSICFHWALVIPIRKSAKKLVSSDRFHCSNMGSIVRSLGTIVIVARFQGSLKSKVWFRKIGSSLPAKMPKVK